MEKKTLLKVMEKKNFIERMEKNFIESNEKKKLY